jgi:hypothetical protein
MRVGKLLRWSTVAAGIAVGTLACSDTSTAPSELAVAEPVVNGEWLSVSGSGGHYEGQFRFEMDPNRNYDVQAGFHRLRIPAGVICDPSTTRYGREEWDKPCKVATKKFTMTVVYKQGRHAPEVRLQPDVRFAPSVDPLRWVTLSMKLYGNMDPMESYNILWYNSGQWVDESKTDPSLRPVEDRVLNRVTRRLKHFSGYSVTARSGGGEETSSGGGY